MTVGTHALTICVHISIPDQWVRQLPGPRAPRETPGLAVDIAKQGLEIGAFYIGRGYVKASRRRTGPGPLVLSHPFADGHDRHAEAVEFEHGLNGADHAATESVECPDGYGEGAEE